MEITNTTSVVQIKNLLHQFHLGKEVVTAVNQVSLEIDRGDFVSLVGPSGSGKSTLLHLIGGLCRPSGGEIKVNGQSIFSMNENQLAIFRRKHLGFVFQSFNLLPNLTALENVALPLMFAGVTLEERLVKSKEVLELVGLSNRLDHKPMEMSGGQQQRVSIARALVNEPVLILADEPTGSLDTQTSEEIIDLLTLFNRERGCTVLLVTHDLEATRISNKIVFFRDGIIEKIQNHHPTSPRGAHH